MTNENNAVETDENNDLKYLTEADLNYENDNEINKIETFKDKVIKKEKENEKESSMNHLKLLIELTLKGLIKTISPHIHKNVNIFFNKMKDMTLKQKLLSLNAELIYDKMKKYTKTMIKIRFLKEKQILRKKIVKWNNFCKIHNKISEEKNLIEQNANNSLKITLKSKSDSLEVSKKNLVEKHNKNENLLREEGSLKENLRKINSMKKDFFNELNEQNVRQIYFRNKLRSLKLQKIQKSMI